MRVQWYSHENEVRRLLADVEAALIEDLKFHRVVPNFLTGLVQWAELAEAAALQRHDQALAQGCRSLSQKLRSLGDAAWKKEQEEGD